MNYGYTVLSENNYGVMQQDKGLVQSASVPSPTESAAGNPHDEKTQTHYIVLFTWQSVWRF